MATSHEPPADFVRRLHAAFPDFVDLRWNTHFSRWEFIFLSAAGRPVSQFWGWTRNPLTGEPIAPDPDTLLPPFRDLDASAQEEIMRNCEQTFIGNRADATRDWRGRFRAVREHNESLRAARHKQRGQDFADMLAEFDIRRPGWLKESSPEYRRLRERQRAAAAARAHGLQIVSR